MGDGMLYKINDVNTHIIDLDSTTGPNGYTCQMSLMNDKNRTAPSIRERLDAFKTINIIETLSFNATLATPVPTSNSCNSRIFDFANVLGNINSILQCLESDSKKFEDFVEEHK